MSHNNFKKIKNIFVLLASSVRNTVTRLQRDKTDRYYWKIKHGNKIKVNKKLEK